MQRQSNQTNQEKGIRAQKEIRILKSRNHQNQPRKPLKPDKPDKGAKDVDAAAAKGKGEKDGKGKGKGKNDKDQSPSPRLTKSKRNHVCISAFMHVRRETSARIYATQTTNIPGQNPTFLPRRRKHLRVQEQQRLSQRRICFVDSRCKSSDFVGGSASKGAVRNAKKWCSKILKIKECFQRLVCLRKH